MLLIITLQLLLILLLLLRLLILLFLNSTTSFIILLLPPLPIAFAKVASEAQRATQVWKERSVVAPNYNFTIGSTTTAYNSYFLIVLQLIINFFILLHTSTLSATPLLSATFYKLLTSSKAMQQGLLR